MDSPRTKALIFRIAAHVAIAALAVMLPAVGPNRFWVAGLLVGVGSPIAVALNLRVNESSRNWVEAMFDLIMIVTLVHLVPHLWVVTMCLGLMVALAPSVSLHPASHWIYLGFGLTLLTGMTFAAVMHNVVGWELPILAVAVTYPSMLYYTYTQMQRTNELRQRAEMMRGMTQLAGSVAHDFNNMLTSVSGHAELALADLPEAHEARENISHVLDGAERASLLCAQLLSFAGRSVDQRDRVDLRAEVQTMAGLLEPAMPAGVRITVETPEHPLYVDAETSQVHQVLLNILLNASEAMMGRRGEIKVQLFRIANTDRATQGEVGLTVSDGGRGIPDKVLNQIYDPFYTTKQDGHGLGLATSRKIMQDLDGAITINSQSTGTEVRLTWPEAMPAKAPSPTVSMPNETKDAPKRVILVVDDDPRVRKVASRLLAHLNFETKEACDADEAVAVFGREHALFCAVLLDLKMPIKDGWSCLRELRAINKDTPVIVCSGFDPHASFPDFAQGDANLSFLRKPYRVNQLTSVLNSHNVPVVDSAVTQPELPRLSPQNL